MLKVRGFVVYDDSNPEMAKLTEDLFSEYESFVSSQKFKLGDKVRVTCSFSKLMHHMQGTHRKHEIYAFAEVIINSVGTVVDSENFSDAEGTYYTVDYPGGGGYVVLPENAIKLA